MQLDLVDVFGARAFAGKPLGVVHGAADLSDAAMLQLTRWLGFSETTFLLPPSDPAADYRVRIFYPAGELPFAGHPTLGTAHAWLRAGGTPRMAGRIMQQCGVGLKLFQWHEPHAELIAQSLLLSIDPGEAKAMFEEEARIASHVCHSNVVNIFDTGCCDGTVCRTPPSGQFCGMQGATCETCTAQETAIAREVIGASVGDVRDVVAA